MSTAALASAAASLMCIGFDHDPKLDPDGASFPEATGELIRLGASGAILFKRNIRSPQQLVRLTFALKKAAKRPFVLAIDQEGGRVARLRGMPFSDIPPMRQLGLSGDQRAAFACGRTLAGDLSHLGFDVDFAPVLDVDTNPDNPVIGDRSLSADPKIVARLGVALAEGIEEGGVASCAKHFPGHGDTAQDSHLVLPRLTHALERLRAVELLPFAAYARARLAAVMSAHVVFEALDPSVPATFSARIQTDLLRGELGFKGLSVCDDLEMKAISDNWPIGEAAVRAVRAGIDWLLVCHHPEVQLRCVEALIHEAERSAGFRRRLGEAHCRVETFAYRWYRPVSLGAIEAIDKLMRTHALSAQPQEGRAADISLAASDCGDGSDPTNYLDKAP